MYKLIDYFEGDIKYYIDKKGQINELANNLANLIKEKLS